MLVQLFAKQLESCSAADLILHEPILVPLLSVTLKIDSTESLGLFPAIVTTSVKPTEKTV